MTKPIGSRSNQFSSNDRLGRFAFLDKIPPDVLNDLQQLAWHFQSTVQVESGETLGPTKAVANQAYVQGVMNGASPVTLVDGTPTVLPSETLANRTLIFTGTLTSSHPVTFTSHGQWFVINRSTGAPVVIQGPDSTKTVSLIAGESAALYIDSTGVSFLSSPLASFLSLYPFTAVTNQTEFDLPYTPNMVLGFSGGKTYLPGQDFDASTGTKVVLNQGAVAGSQWTFLAITSSPVADAVPLSGGVMQGPLVLAPKTTVPTQPIGTNDNTLATSAALYQGLRAIPGVLDIATASLIINPAESGTVISLSSETGVVGVLPDLSALPSGTALLWFDLVNTSAAGIASITGKQGFNLKDPYTGVLTTTFILGPGESVRLIADLANQVWRVGVGLARGQGRLIGIKRYLQAGTYQYSRTPGTRMILVHGAGGGGASGGLPACMFGYVAIAQAGSPGARAYAEYTANFDGVIITVGAGGATVEANDDGQNGNDGCTSSFGTLLTIPGGKGGTTAITNSTVGITAYLGAGALQPTGQGIINSSYGMVAPPAFVNSAGMFGGIATHAEGLEGGMNGLGGLGQYSIPGAVTASTPTNAGTDGGFLIYEMT
jgi:hypothetical protein